MKKIYNSFLVGLFVLLLPFNFLQAKDVALLEDSDYSNLNESCFGEAFSWISTVENLGHTVNKFAGISKSDFETAVMGQDALLFPSLDVHKFSIVLQ